LISSGLDIDIVTGLPIEEEEDKKKRESEIKRNKIINRYNNLVSDLCGRGGAVVEAVTEQYIARVEDLISNDPVCQEYQKLFDSLGMQLNAGKKVVLSKSKDLKEV
jgi:DNA-directed RNA polymerase subunit N (RpoN/RPB10)